MVRMESDAGLRQALIRAAMARQAGEEIVVETAVPSESSAEGMPDAFDEMPKANFDPGLTGEIHLNLSDEE